MSANRLFHVVIVAALVVVTALTIQAALQTTMLVSAGSTASACARPEISRASIHSVFAPERGMLVISSNVAPTGVDGGLIALLSGYRTCSN